MLISPHLSSTISIFFHERWHNKLPLLKQEASLEYVHMRISVVRVRLSVRYLFWEGSSAVGLYASFPRDLLLTFFVSFLSCFIFLLYHTDFSYFSLIKNDGCCSVASKLIFFFHSKVRNAHSFNCLVELWMKHLQAVWTTANDGPGSQLCWPLSLCMLLSPLGSSFPSPT